ncbi:hypothetical protein MSG28_007696 [Choristoneura fumiferana]|uniref:Uncharacterized protein n=1 Tax=Choristoneura fumiferana TaxID=7141 RepID=A0ACC0JYE3_CHOFU|nr:hypothetical protein MSG28_007696 [Choristoneura fumiferana]
MFFGFIYEEIKVVDSIINEEMDPGNWTNVWFDLDTGQVSVSASMEEISKIQEAKNKDLGSQVSLGPAEAAIAQSQHFDQLEALWNKVSPPRRRSNKSLSKQSSLIERLDSSDEDHTPVEEQVYLPKSKH